MSWSFPSLEPGDVVLFSLDTSDRRQHPAFVVSVNPNSVDLAVIGANTRMTGVRHRDDPALVGRPDLIQDAGVFTLAPSTQRLRTMQETLNEMAAEVGKLRRTSKTGS